MGKSEFKRSDALELLRQPTRRRAEGRESAEADQGPLWRALAGVDGPLVDRAVGRLNEIQVRKGLEAAREIAECVLGLFFDGSLETYQQGGSRHLSFRALENHPGLSVSYSMIRNALAVLDQLRLLPREVGDALSFTHHKCLLVVTDPACKERLARHAVSQSWSSRQLAAAVRQEVDRGARLRPGRGGRPALPAYVKTVRGWKRLVESPAGQPDGFADLERVDELPLEEARRLLPTVLALEAQCHRLHEALARRLEAEE